MAQQTINIGAADAKTGDTLFTAFTKTDDNFDQIFAALENVNDSVQVVIINELADFPTPIAGVIPLLQDTKYLIASNVNIGANTLKMADGTSVTGVDSLVVDLTYTGTGDMFTGIDVSIRITNVGIVCNSGRFINWVDSLGKVLRLTDLGISCDRFGVITGLVSFVRMTNVSPTTITTQGMLYSGTFGAVQYDSSLANISAGVLVDLGTAVFTSLSIANVISTISAGATFLSGLINSGNIAADGTGSLLATRLSGAGTRLNNISVDDTLWQFLLNDDIADTRPDGLLSMQGNATASVITVASTYVLIAGVWSTERVSQFSATAAGRLTYNGGKDATLPETLSVSVEPVSGASKDISVQYAKNGVLVPSSKRTSRTSSGTPSSITLPWQDVLSTGDFVEWFVTNDTDTVDILVSSAISRIN